MYAPVSVIIPCYQCQDTIVRAIDSIHNQTLVPMEVILVDDCSQDATLDFLYSLRNNYPKGWLQVFSLKRNAGPGSARNKGWEHASQDYIAFLDSDDSWHPNKIEIQYLWMSENKSAVMTAHTSEIYEDRNIDGELNNVFNQINFSTMIYSNIIPTRSVMLKRTIELRFVNGKRYAEDYLLWMLIIAKYSQTYFLNKPLAYSYKNDFDAGGLTSNLWKMHCGLLDAYQILFNKKHISITTLISIYAINYLKLSIRTIKKLCLSFK